MEFNDFKKVMQQHISDMIRGQDKLFLTDVNKDDLWHHYLESFPPGTNEVYKERREYDCNSCKQFIRPYANVVAIKDNKLVSVWDIPGLVSPFKEVAVAMSKLVKSGIIKDIFVTRGDRLGTDNNKQLLPDGKVLTWEHFYYKWPTVFLSDDIAPTKGKHRDSKNVFQRSMTELTVDAGQIILELIEQGSLYRGEEHKTVINKFISYKKRYDKLKAKERDNWCWSESFNNPISRIRNTAIGTLLIDLSEDVDVDVAVTKFEKVMAPDNYKRPNAIFTKKMVEDAEKQIESLGFSDSLARRFAQLKDITVNNLLFVNRDAKKKLKGSASVFDELKEGVPENTKKFDKVEVIGIEDFVKSILPSSTSIELMVENKHGGNFMSLVAPENKEAPTMFKWNNNFSWAYNGDITDSAIKRNVKNAGGNVEGVLRFSIQWNDDRDNNNDFDAHCKEPGGNIIMYSNALNHATAGNLDVDITQPMRQVPDGPAVENITWPDVDKMEEGKYKFLVHNYSHRGGRSGFSAEIEYDGQIYSYEYAKELKYNEKVSVAEIMFNKETGIKFIKSLDSSVSLKEIWGVNTNVFSKVSVCMFSPNYWDKQRGIGNRHYFFFFDGCQNETTPRGFFNEFLNEALTPHRKVFEALGSRMRVADADTQLSGVGFSSTQRNSVLARVEGAFKRVIKINF